MPIVPAMYVLQQQQQYVLSHVLLDAVYAIVLIVFVVQDVVHFHANVVPDA